MARTKSKTELFGKHPLAKSIEPVIEKWSQENYPAVNGKQITHATRELMDYWFSDMAHEGEAFHICQRRAIETINPLRNYVLLPQNIFDEMEGSGLQSLIERCESNLALLKMRKE